MSDDEIFYSLPAYIHDENHEHDGMASFTTSPKNKSRPFTDNLCTNAPLSRWNARTNLDSAYTSNETNNLTEAKNHDERNQYSQQKLLAINDKVVCVTCGVNYASVRCDVCEDSRCQNCDIKWHNHSKRKTHQRRKSQKNPTNESMNSVTMSSDKTKNKSNIIVSTEVSPVAASGDVVDEDEHRHSQRNEDKRIKNLVKDSIITTDIALPTRKKNEDSTVVENFDDCDAKCHNHSQRKMNQRKSERNSKNESINSVVMLLPEKPKNEGDIVPTELALEASSRNMTDRDRKCHKQAPTPRNGYQQIQNSENYSINTTDQSLLQKPKNKDSVGQCALCGIAISTVQCDECGKARCAQCDEKWHGHKTRRMHKRKRAPSGSERFDETMADLVKATKDEISNFKENCIIPVSKQGSDMTSHVESYDWIPSGMRSETDIFFKNSIDNKINVLPNILIKTTVEKMEIQKTSADKPSKHKEKQAFAQNQKSILKHDQCVLCGLEDAIVLCNECDDARCVECDEKWHRHKKRNKHTRSEISSSHGNGNTNETTRTPSIRESQVKEKSSNNTITDPCILCGLEHAIMFCNECGDARCSQCDEKWHRHKKRNDHTRSQISSSHGNGNTSETSRIPTENQVNEKYNTIDPCILCGLEHAIMVCNECGDARCSQCDEKWHRHKKRNDHTRSQISSSNGNGNTDGTIRTQSIRESQVKQKSSNNTITDPCVLCGLDDAIVLCNECGDARCSQCDEKWHRHKKRGKHARSQISRSYNGNTNETSIICTTRENQNEETTNNTILECLNNDATQQSATKQGLESASNANEVKVRMNNKDVNSNAQAKLASSLANNSQHEEFIEDACALCGISEAVVPCKECGDAKCLQCDEKWHRHKKRNRHERPQTSLLIQTRNELTTESDQSIGTKIEKEIKQTIKLDFEKCCFCGIEDATISCDECGDARCVRCDGKWHLHKLRNTHLRVNILMDTHRELEKNSKSYFKNKILRNEQSTPQVDSSDPGLREDIQSCDVCGLADGTIMCKECSYSLCSQCDDKMHRNVKRKTHQRTAALKKESGCTTASSSNICDIETDSCFIDEHPPTLPRNQNNHKDISSLGPTSKIDNQFTLNYSVNIKAPSTEYYVSDMKRTAYVPDQGMDTVVKKLTYNRNIVIEKINAIQAQLNSTEINNQEQYKVLQDEKEELLRKSDMLMVRINAISTISCMPLVLEQNDKTISSQSGLNARRPYQSTEFKNESATITGIGSATACGHRSGRTNGSSLIASDVYTDNYYSENHKGIDHEKVMHRHDDSIFMQAKAKGFSADDLKIASTQCKNSHENVLHWLEYKYKGFIAKVWTMSNNRLRRIIPGAKIAESSVMHFLIKHPDDVSKATDACVRNVQAQICEIHQLGLRKENRKLTMYEVSEYLFNCNGNVEKVMTMMKRNGVLIDTAAKIWSNDEREMFQF